jgi:hypothetical protein
MGPAFAAQAGQQRIGAELVVIGEVLIPQRQGVNSLSQQWQKRMFDELGIAMVPEAGGQALQVSKATIQPGQEHPAAVTGNMAAGEIHRDRFGG